MKNSEAVIVTRAIQKYSEARMLTLTLGLLLANPAAAEDGTAQPGTVEHAIKSSIELITSGETESWLSDWCHPERCGSVEQRRQWTEFALKRAAKSASRCLHGPERTPRIVRWRGDPKVDERVTVYIDCGDDRMPVPSSHIRVGERWMVTSLSW